MDIARSEKVGFSHHKIHTEIEIDAAPDIVWSVLTDTSSYTDWAAFLVEIKGEIKDGSKITALFKLNSNKNELTRIDHVISVEEGRSFWWAEKGPGGIRDNHHFTVEESNDGKSRFIQSDEIMGGVTWLMGGRLAKMYVAGYQAFNRGLKQEAERRAKTA